MWATRFATNPFADALSPLPEQAIVGSGGVDQGAPRRKLNGGDAEPHTGTAKTKCGNAERTNPSRAKGSDGTMARAQAAGVAAVAAAESRSACAPIEASAESATHVAGDDSGAAWRRPRARWSRAGPRAVRGSVRGAVHASHAFRQRRGIR